VDMEMAMLFFSERFKAASLQDLQKTFAEAVRKLLSEADPVTCDISAVDFTKMNTISMTLTLSSTTSWLGMTEANGESDATSS
jgi:hypothetical protein